MKRSFRKCLVIGVVVSIFSSALWAGTRPSEGADGFAGSFPGQQLVPTLTVRVYDYSGVPAAQLAEMETEVTRILSKAGIRSAWLNCRVSVTELAKHPDCEHSRTPTTIVLRIVEGGSTTMKRFGYTGLGFSVVADVGGFLATVIMSRVEQVSRKGAATRGQILGHAAAHEIGHLFLNSTSHSLAGIMQAHWDRGDLRKMAAGHLLFTSQEAGLMRGNVVRRSRR